MKTNDQAVAGCVFAALAVCGAGCDRSARVEEPAQPQSVEVKRVAAEAKDLRVMVTDVAATRACERFRNLFRPIQGTNTTSVTGVIWIQECDAFANDSELTLQLAGRGWRWIERTTETVAGDFSVDTYARFEFSVELQGPVDVAYARDEKILTMWFTPEGEPKTTFEVIGDVNVAEESVWASVIGAVGSAFGASPEERAEQKVGAIGGRKLANRFSQGLAVTMNLCSGEVRSQLGHPPAGEMIGPADTVHRTTATLHPGGLILDGPVRLPPGGLDAKRPASARSQLVCLDDALTLAQAFIDGAPLPEVPAAGEDGSCSRVHVVRPRESLSNSVEVHYTVTEAVANTGALARCRAQ